MKHILLLFVVLFLPFPFIITGDVLVILDLRQDESLFEAGVAREVIIGVNSFACGIEKAKRVDSLIRIPPGVSIVSFVSRYQRIFLIKVVSCVSPITGR